MKTIDIQPRTALFTGVLDIIAESLGRPRARTAVRQAEAVAAPSRPGFFVRAGDWLWRREMRGVDAYVARADAMFVALDRWLWKQRIRETEAWLAKSQDLFELEARIRHLERGPQGRMF